MALLMGAAARTATGTLTPRSDVFQTISNESRCVICSRAVGKYATGSDFRQLIAEPKNEYGPAMNTRWLQHRGFIVNAGSSYEV